MYENRTFQGDALDRVSKHWKQGRRHVLLVAPTGAGKGTMCGMMAERVVKKNLEEKRDLKVLVMAHRRRLIQQLSERMQLLGVEYTVEMADLPDAEWVRRESSATVIIASRDTVRSRMDRNGLPQVDLFIPDEAHNWDNGESLKLAKSLKAKYWLGMTATACRGDGSGLGKANWDVIVEAATDAQLVEWKYLVSVKCFAPPEIGEKRKRGDKTPVAGDPVRHWMKYAEGKRTVGFTESVAGANAVRDQFLRAGVRAAVISAKTPDSEREDIIGGIRDGKILWCGNVAVLTEGVDVPEWEVCQLLCKCGSYVKYKQAVGRIRRPSPHTGKKHGILLDHSGAVYAHGLPEESVEWVLEESDNLHERIKKEREDGKRSDPILCQSCGALFAGSPVCPSCGQAPPRREKREQPELASEKLVQVTALEENPYLIGLRQQREWTSMLHQCKAMGKPATVASSMFRRKFGMWPEAAGVEPVWDFDDRKRPVRELLEEIRNQRA